MTELRRAARRCIWYIPNVKARVALSRVVSAGGEKELRTAAEASLGFIGNRKAKENLIRALQ